MLCGKFQLELVRHWRGVQQSRHFDRIQASKHENVFRVWEDRLDVYPDDNVIPALDRIATLHIVADVVARNDRRGAPILQFSHIRKVQRKIWQDTCTRSQ